MCERTYFYTATYPSVGCSEALGDENRAVSLLVVHCRLLHPGPGRFILSPATSELRKMTCLYGSSWNPPELGAPVWQKWSIALILLPECFTPVSHLPAFREATAYFGEEIRKKAYLMVFFPFLWRHQTAANEGVPLSDGTNRSCRLSPIQYFLF